MAINKCFTPLILLLFFVKFSAAQQAAYDPREATLKARAATDAEFRDTLRSPLIADEIKTFRGLKYFDYDMKYNIKALLIRNPDPWVFGMMTTTDRRPEYKAIGEIHFNLDGETYQLKVFQNVELAKKPEFANSLFLAFVDETSGIETYGGGRFMDLEDKHADTVDLDFNKAYNPYCAYNHKYSCPRPVAENFLPIKILAGEKIYKEASGHK